MSCTSTVQGYINEGASGEEIRTLRRMQMARLIAALSNDIPVARRVRRSLLQCLLSAPALRVSTGVRLDRSHPDLGGQLVLGSHVELGPRVVLDVSGGITIEDRVTLSVDTLVLSHDHTVSSAAMHWREQEIMPRPVTIQEGAWIGSRAIILGATENIGRGAIVGAGSIVTKRVPDNAIVVGNPARQIGERH